MIRTSVLYLVALTVLVVLPAHAADRMDTANVTKVMSGKTLIGATASGVGYESTFASNGEISVETDGYGSDTGRWWVTDKGLLCQKFNRFYDGLERCVWFESATNANGVKAYIEGTNEPTYFRFKN